MRAVDAQGVVFFMSSRRRFFFFKQKTAYEIMPSLVGSEMCIRDSDGSAHDSDFAGVLQAD